VKKPHALQLANNRVRLAGYREIIHPTFTLYSFGFAAPTFRRALDNQDDNVDM
jgi:hypothetical protein